MLRWVTPLTFSLALGTIAQPDAMAAQQAEYSPEARGPRFLLASAGQAEPMRIDVGRTPVLLQQLSLRLDDATVKEALAEISRQAHLNLVYGDDVLRTDARVNLRAEQISAAAALTEVLINARVDVVFTRDGRATLVPQPPADPLPGTITGRVTEVETGNPIVNAQIAVDGRGRALTDNDGRYRVNDVEPGRRTISVTSIGYAPVSQDVEVNDGATVTVDFELAASPSPLDEIVVTVTGEQRRREVGHVVGRITVDSIIRTAPVSSFTDVLNGRVAGVQVLPTNGIAGDAPRIRVRGISSTTATNDPIVIVDGVRFEQSPNPAGQPPPSTRFGRLGSALADLNPDEIASIEVAKGPSAATLYGTDAANGVIIVTTKRGQPGRTRWHVYAEQGISNSTAEWPDNYFAFGHLTSTGEPTQCILTQVAAGACVQDSVAVTSPLTNPETSPLGTGYRQQTGLQVSGGTDVLRYFVSGEFENELGVYRLPDAEIDRVKEERQVSEIPSAQERPNQVHKGTLRANLTAQLADNADVTLSTMLVRNDTRLPDDNAILAPGWFGIGFHDSPNFFDRAFGGAPGDAFSKTSLQSTNRFTTSVAANWRAMPWLATRATVGADFRNTFFEGLQPLGQGVTTLASLGGKLNQRTSVERYTVDVNANASVPLSSSISSSTAVGVQYNRRDRGQTSINATGLTVGSQSATGATTIVSTEQNLATVVAGAYIQQTFSLNERLFLTGAVRADGATAFGSDFATAFYPKASASWVISEEPFFGRPGWLTSLRLRGAFGQTGVQPDPTAGLITAIPVSVFAEGAAQSGAIFNALGNPDLGPELQTEVEAGVDLDILAGRLRLEATYYNRKSADALVNVPLPPSIGFGSRQENIGSVRNSGVEAQLSARVIDSDRTGLEVGFNGSYNRNRLLKLAPDVDRLEHPFSVESREGYPVFSAWSRKLVSFEDANADGIIGRDEVVLSDTAVFLGPLSPTRQISAWANVSLLGGLLQVRTLFDHRGGHTFSGVADRNRCLFTFNCRGVNDPSASLEEQARAVAMNAIGFSFADPQKANFVRWKELSAQLNFPERLAARVGARTASLTLGVRNLALWTADSFRSIDPEMAGQRRIDSPASFPVVPPLRTWTIRVDLDY